MDDVTPTPSGVSMDVNIDTPITQPQADGSKAWLDSMPEAYRAKEWAQNIAKAQDPLAEMAKQFDNQLSLIGRKAEGLKVPGEGATPEDWANFHKAIGVPESADKYEYAAPEVPEHLKQHFQQDDNLINHMREAALKAGVRPEGFKLLAEAFDKYYMGELENAVKANNELFSKLETNFKQKFGDRSTQVLNEFNQSMNGLLSKEQAAVIEQLDPTVKVALAEWREAFAKKYIREGDMNLDIPSQGTGMTKTEYGEEYARLFAKQREARRGSEAYEVATRELDALRKKGEQIFKQ